MISTKGLKSFGGILLLLILSFTVQARVVQYNKIVAKDGSGDYLTVQAAIDAAPTGQTTPYRIFIKSGTYTEVVTVPSNKPFIQLVGEDVSKTIITYNNYFGKSMSGGGTYGTSTSSTITVNATDFSAANITFANSTGDSPQAVAINVNNDRCSFKNCRFLGGQDTLLANNSGKKQYYLNCYIDGVVDFIFGDARAVFDYCTIYPKDRVDKLANSYMTATNTKSTEPYGYVFRNCKITQNTGVTKYVLGRPWQNDASTADASKSRNKTVFLNTTMSPVVSTTGWSTWDTGTDVSLITYAEYKSKDFSGNLVDVSSRVSWSKQLTDEQAAVYSDANLFEGWDPTAVFLDGSSYTTPLVASNLKASRTSNVVTLTWNLSWYEPGVTTKLFRSADNGSTYSEVSNSITTVNEVNYSTTDAAPPSGSSYLYYVEFSKSGLTTTSSDVITVSSIPTITASGSIGSFAQGVGTPSSTQAYSVSAVNLTSDLTITPPAGYEVSSNGGTTWYTNSNPLVLTQSSGSVPSTTITVRLNASSAGTYSGNILHASAGATTVNQAVSGTVQSAPLIVLSTIISWPLTSSSADDATVRATGVAASAPTFTNLTLSNGTTLSTVPAYSATFGQAFGASTNGDGTWTTAVGGPAGTLSRTTYEQFTVTAATGYQVRVDSIILASSFYNTSSNTKLAVSYSTDNFTTIQEVTGGSQGSTALTSSANGAFTTPIALSNETAGTTVTYRLALNGSTGITLSAGKTLTVRLYFSCGSSSNSRYGKLKNLSFKGQSLNTLPLSLVSFTAKAGNGVARQVNVAWKTTKEDDVKGFEVERSVDGNTFIKIAEVAASNTTGEHSYSANDNNPVSGTAYYRLKMIDLDGNFSYSSVKEVSLSSAAGFSIYPNPVNTTLSVNFNAIVAEGSVSVSNLNGQIVVSQKLSKGATNASIDVASLPAGSYVVTVKDGSGKSSSKFIKL